MPEPLRVGMKYPMRIESKVVADFTSRFNLSLDFYGTDDSRITIILSERQADALMGTETRDPARMARGLFIDGHIDANEYERRLNCTILHDA